MASLRKFTVSLFSILKAVRRLMMLYGPSCKMARAESGQRLEIFTRQLIALRERGAFY